MQSVGTWHLSKKLRQRQKPYDILTLGYGADTMAFRYYINAALPVGCIRPNDRSQLRLPLVAVD